MFSFFKNAFCLIKDNTFTKGCALGIIYVGLLWLIVEIIKLYIYLKRRNQYISVSSDNDSNFLLSFKAIRNHLKILLSKQFKEVTLKDIIINKKGDKNYIMKLIVKIGGSMDLKVLGRSIHSSVKDAIDNVIGLPNVFTHIDVVISNLRSDRNAMGKNSTTASAKMRQVETQSSDTPEVSNATQLKKKKLAQAPEEEKPQTPDQSFSSSSNQDRLIKAPIDDDKSATITPASSDI